MNHNDIREYSPVDEFFKLLSLTEEEAKIMEAKQAFILEQMNILR